MTLGKVSYAMLSMGMIVLMSIGLSTWVKNTQVKRLETFVHTNARLFSVKLDAQLQEKFVIAEVFRDQLENTRISLEERFRLSVPAMFDHLGDLKALNWVSSDGVISVIFPQKGNEAALGLNLSSLPSPAAALQNASRTRELALTQPLTLAQGGHGFTAYVPIETPDGIGGYLNLVFRATPLIEAVLGPWQGQSFSIAVWDSGVPVYGDFDAIAARPFAAEVTLEHGGRLWNIAMAPTRSTIAAHVNMLDKALQLSGLVLSLVLGVMIYCNRRDQDAIRDREERFSLAMMGASDGLYDLDLLTSEIYLSPRWFQMLGYEPDDFHHSINTIRSLIHPDDREPHSKAMEMAVENGASHIERELRMKHSDGTWRTFLSRAFIARKSGVAIRIVGTHVDITEDRNREQTLAEAAKTDPLTGLCNRRGLGADLVQVVASLAKGERLAAFHVDLDGFKRINDFEGHQAGDQALCHVSDQLRSLDGAVELIARVGGDEFMLVVRIGQSDEAVSIWIDRILEAASKPMLFRGKCLYLNASLGVSMISGIHEIDEALADADIALMQAKARGGSAAVVFEPSMRKEAMERAKLQSDIQRALADGEFTAYFQPQVNLQTGQLIGFEALARWLHPEKGIISAGSFMHVLEDSIIVRAIDEQVLIHACHALKALDPVLAGKPTVSVNLSTLQLQTPGIANRIRDLVRGHGLEPHRFCIEILETTLLSERAPMVRKNVRELAAAGFQIELDDFGTGHTAISSLLNFPISRMKIDRSLIRNVDSDPRLQAVVKALLELGANLGVDVLAEGIETGREAEFLASVQCHLAQGYLVSHPLPLDEILAWVDDWAASFSARELRRA